MQRPHWPFVLSVLSSVVLCSIPRPTEVSSIRANTGAMCRAMINEMHIEILKHNLRQAGEDDIYETVPAICLGVVQNYTFEAPASATSDWLLQIKVWWPKLPRPLFLHH
jgi:hypothetical protein